MLSNTSELMFFAAVFTSSNQAVTAGITPTFDLYQVKTDGTVTQVVTAASMIQVGKGFIYVYAGNATQGAYIGWANTAATVDLKNVPAMWINGQPWVTSDTSGIATLLNRIAASLTITAGKVDVNDKTGFALTGAYDAAKTAAQAGAAMTLTSGERTAINQALLDEANGIETGLSLRATMRIMGAALAGILSGADGTDVTIQAMGGGKVRISATVDASGNRTAVTLDGTP